LAFEKIRHVYSIRAEILPSYAVSSDNGGLGALNFDFGILVALFGIEPENGPSDRPQ
jgi:hypothetical protein